MKPNNIELAILNPTNIAPNTCKMKILLDKAKYKVGIVIINKNIEMNLKKNTLFLSNFLVIDSIDFLLCPILIASLFMK